MSDIVSVIIDLAVLLLFLVGIWWFRSPTSARSGSLLIAVALLCGVAVVLVRQPLHSPVLVLVALIAGSAIGWLAARRITMIRIPAMVAFQNGAGGLAAALVAFVEVRERTPEAGRTDLWAGLLALLIGGVTFAGSMVAGSRLAGWLRSTPAILPRHNTLTVSLAIVSVVFAVSAGLDMGRMSEVFVIVLVPLALMLGSVWAIRIGGADMPVLISCLNALSGMAAAFCGVAVASRLLTACGAMVAASGLLLTHAMCRAMNRSWQSVLLGMAPGATLDTLRHAACSQPDPDDSRGQDESGRAQFVRAVDAMRNARSVIFVPGYGLALANAQQVLVQLAEYLTSAGKDTRFGIHPIAGRMPGHMHVLLAEADVDADMLVDLEDINPAFPETDLVVVVGACDVVNPAAIHVEGTPISGMPVLAAHEARQVLICNLDLRPGYSGVDNPLYQDPKAILLLGDARNNLLELLESLNAPASQLRP